jgi:hypothetical protein
MPKHSKQIIAEALELLPVERAELIEHLLTSFKFQFRKRIDALTLLKDEEKTGEVKHSISPPLRYSPITGERNPINFRGRRVTDPS